MKMKVKFVLIAALTAGLAGTVSAQEKYYSESFKDNFFVSVGVGIQGTTNPDTKFGNSITPLVNISAGKYITPVWAVRGQIYGWSSKMVTNYPFASVDAPAVKRLENYVGANIDGILNLSSLFGGYKPGRAFEFTLFAGPSMNVVGNYSGWKAGYDEVRTPVEGGTRVDYILNPSKCEPTGHDVRWLVGASVGLGAHYNISSEFAVDLEVRGQVSPSILGAYSSGRTDGYLYMNAGVTYNIGGRKFTQAGANAAQTRALENDINTYKQQVESLERARQLAQDEVERLQATPVVVHDTVYVTVAGPRSIFFKIGSSKTDDFGKVNLKQAAEIMKQNPDQKYRIMGYADSATGSAAFNQKLSEKRAKEVYDFLVSEGVNPEQLEVIGCGGTDALSKKSTLNRVVVIE